MPNTRKNPRDPDSPFITAEGMAKAVPFRQRFPTMDTSSIIAIAEPATRRETVSPRVKKRITFRLSQDVIAELRATGPDLDQLADDLLRSGLKRRRRASPRAVQE